MIFLLCEWPGTGGMDAGSCWKSPSVDGARKDVCAGAQAQTHVRTHPCTVGVPGVCDPGLHHPRRAPRALPAPCPVLAAGCCLSALWTESPPAAALPPPRPLLPQHQPDGPRCPLWPWPPSLPIVRQHRLLVFPVLGVCLALDTESVPGSHPSR